MTKLIPAPAGCTIAAEIAYAVRQDNGSYRPAEWRGRQSRSGLTAWPLWLQEGAIPVYRVMDSPGGPNWEWRGESSLLVTDARRADSGGEFSAAEVWRDAIDAAVEAWRVFRRSGAFDSARPEGLAGEIGRRATRVSEYGFLTEMEAMGLARDSSGEYTIDAGGVEEIHAAGYNLAKQSEGWYAWRADGVYPLAPHPEGGWQTCDPADTEIRWVIVSGGKTVSGYPTRGDNPGRWGEGAVGEDTVNHTPHIEAQIL